MKRLIIPIGLLIWTLSGAVRASVAPGENLLVNGALGGEQAEFPEFWSPNPAKNVIYLRAGGPQGKPAIALRSEGVSPVTISARQQGLTLVAGETYRISAWIKTAGFKCHGGGLIVHNNGWISATGITTFPPDSDWTYREKTFKAMPSKGSEYGVAAYATSLSGEILFADLKLEATSEAALKGSSSQMLKVAAPRLVPMSPLLNRIPRADPRLTLRLFGQLPDKAEAYECVVTAGGLAPQSCPIRQGAVTAALAGLPCGDAPLKAVLRRRDSGETILEARWDITIIDPPAIDSSGIRPLNMLVAELLDKPLEKSAGPRAFTFTNPRDGWVFVALEGAQSDPGLSIKIDDQPVKMGSGVPPSGGIPAEAGTPEHAYPYAFRELAMGAHRVTVAGAPAASRLRVNSIPEIFDYPPCTDSFVRENGHYDWAFMKRHILPAVTTLNGGQLPGPALAEAKTMGLKWLANFSATSAEEPIRLRARMEQAGGMTQPHYDGITSDELFFNRANIDNYTRALWGLPNPRNRLIYTWIVGKPSIPAVHTDFMSACLNASRGRGRLIFEAYCHPQADEKTAAAYLDDMIGETMRKFGAFFPGAAEGTGIIFGNFNQIPVISLEHDPAVDYKYFLDMQVNAIANRPEFRNLATTGYWGSYYADEELLRWSFMLMRHYAVEGRKEMLSARYGFSYKPGLLANPDFAEGLAGWAVDAAPGAVRAQTLAGFGKNVERRWGAGAAGDTVCVMKRQEGRPSRLSQTIRGLAPGKAYCLQFVTADLKDVAEKKYNPRQYAIDVELKGVEKLADRSYVHVDRRKEHRGIPPEYLGKINLQHIVFRAKAPEIEVVFTDAQAKPGEELLLNFIQLKPYLE